MIHSTRGVKSTPLKAGSSAINSGFSQGPRAGNQGYHTKLRKNAIIVEVTAVSKPGPG
jgi:hypothetical protein